MKSFISAVTFCRAHSHVSFTNRLLPSRKVCKVEDIATFFEKLIERETQMRETYLRDAA